MLYGRANARVLSRASGHHLGLIQLGEITVWSGRCRQSLPRLETTADAVRAAERINCGMLYQPTYGVSSPCFCQAGLQVARAGCIFTPQTILAKITSKKMSSFYSNILHFCPSCTRRLCCARMRCNETELNNWKRAYFAWHSGLLRFDLWGERFY